MVTLIAAMAGDGLIGRAGDLPWRLSTDLRRFKRLTMGKPLIMGRRTYASIGRPLPGRRCVVLSRTLTEAPAGTTLFESLDAALRALADAPEIIIGGGAAVYAEALPFADRLCLSVVHGPRGRHADDEVYFPAIDAGRWSVRTRKAYPAGARDEWAHTYFDLRSMAPGLEPMPSPFPGAVVLPAPLADA